MSSTTTTARPSRTPRNWQWEEAFDKFGFNDGDGVVMTEVVADALRKAGLAVTTSAWGWHNIVIDSIKRDGTPLFPDTVTLGYDNPRDYLPEDVIALLDRKTLCPSSPLRRLALDASREGCPGGPGPILNARRASHGEA